MATLNVKNLPDALYWKLKARAKREHRSITKEVMYILATALAEPEPLSIAELRGLGKQVWCGVDAAEYVARERRAWD